MILGAVVVAGVLAATGAYYYWQTQQADALETAQTTPQYKTPEEADMFVRFDMEVYDIIMQHYWQKATDADLSTLAQAALQRVTNATSAPTLPSKDRAGVAKMLAANFAQATSTDQKRQTAELEAEAMLYNLAPAGRSMLLSQQQETTLRQEVSNVHPQDDLYKNLNLPEDASTQQVDQAYDQKKAELKNATSTEAKQELAQADYAHKVLSDANNKAHYDQAKIEPTIFGHIIGKALYINMTQVSPTSLQEFALAVDQASTTPGIDSLILDMRGNIGGALDFTAAFLGLFEGANQYAFDLYHQGDLNVQRTTEGKFDELDRFTNVAFLVDGMTQSTAELTTATFKKFHIARIVGTKTRGWGTVEDTFPIKTDIDPKQKFTVLMVHSVTLRDDNQLIEGNGVEPDIDVSSPNWQSQLSKYFTSPNMISALKQVATSPPLK